MGELDQETGNSGNTRIPAVEYPKVPDTMERLGKKTQRLTLEIISSPSLALHQFFTNLSRHHGDTLPLCRHLLKTIHSKNIITKLEKTTIETKWKPGTEIEQLCAEQQQKNLPSCWNDHRKEQGIASALP